MRKYSFDAGIFDMDGVITKTAIVHSDAWKLVFDECLHLIAKRESKPFQEFTHQDYLNYVDGKPRLKGIASFLSSRGITLPLGTDKDKLPQETLYAIGNTKNDKFQNVLKTKGVQLYEPTVALIKDLKLNGIKVGVVSSSKNCEFVLKAAGVLDLFDTRVDGIIAQQLKLEGKPEGDIFVKAAENLGTSPDRSIVFEDAISGVQSGRNGGFGLVVGIARSSNMNELNKNGADVVVDSLSRLNLDIIEKWFNKEPINLLKNWENLADKENIASIFSQEKSHLEINPIYMDGFKSLYLMNGNKVLFLPESLAIEVNVKQKIAELAEKIILVVYSDKQCLELLKNIGIVNAYYLGNNGYAISGKDNSIVEIKKEKTIKDAGQVVRWFLKAAEISWVNSKVIYIGTQQQDEQVFRVVNTRGAGILLCQKERMSSAQFSLNSLNQLEEMLSNIVNIK